MSPTCARCGHEKDATKLPPALVTSQLRCGLCLCLMAQGWQIGTSYLHVPLPS